MKKIILPLCLLTISFLLASHYSIAAPGVGCQGKKACRGNAQQEQQQAVDAESSKKYEKFMAETLDLRKKMEKNVLAYQVLMNEEKPDPKKVALLTEEYYQLRNILTQKAMDAGIMQKKRGCNGCNDKQGVACGMSGAQQKKKIQQSN